MIQETIQSSKAPKAVGPYSPALKIEDFIYLSGQLPVDPETGKIVDGGIEEQTHQCLKNMKALLNQAGIEMCNVVKTNVYLAHMSDFAAMNKVYAQYFKEPYPARCAAGVNELAMGALVEIEAFAVDTRALEVICCKESECGEGGCTCE
jgi:2-iminobutanoate/2-iminopropanoate deaminase